MQFVISGLMVPWWGFAMAVIFVSGIVYYQYKKSRK